MFHIPFTACSADVVDVCGVDEAVDARDSEHDVSDVQEGVGANASTAENREAYANANRMAGADRMIVNSMVDGSSARFMRRECTYNIYFLEEASLILSSRNCATAIDSKPDVGCRG